MSDCSTNIGNSQQQAPVQLLPVPSKLNAMLTAGPSRNAKARSNHSSSSASPSLILGSSSASAHHDFPVPSPVLPIAVGGRSLNLGTVSPASSLSSAVALASVSACDLSDLSSRTNSDSKYNHLSFNESARAFVPTPSSSPLTSPSLLETMVNNGSGNGGTNYQAPSPHQLSSPGLCSKGNEDAFSALGVSPFAMASSQVNKHLQQSRVSPTQIMLDSVRGHSFASMPLHHSHSSHHHSQHHSNGNSPSNSELSSQLSHGNAPRKKQSTRVSPYLVHM